MLGIFNGVFSSSIGLVSLPAPYIGAFLWENIRPSFPFYITAFVALATIIPTWLFFKVPDAKRTATPQAVPENTIPDGIPLTEAAD